MSDAGAPLFSPDMPCYRYIEAGQPFLTVLAQAIHDYLADKDPLSIADIQIYLPTRRATRALREAIVTRASGTASLLPQIKPIGDLDDDSFHFVGNAEDETDLPPAIGATDRRLLLARLVAARNRARFDHDRWANALASADELSKLLDVLHTEEIPSDRLKDAAPAAFAEHWDENLKFLNIVIEAWPAYLESVGKIDPGKRRIALIDRQSARWQDSPPQHPIIIAGTTGSTPAVARMMKIVAALPKGSVILPGLDARSPNDVWRVIDDPHPQSGLKDLLGKFQISRDAVKRLSPESSPEALARQQLISVALRPASASDSWREWTEEIKKNSDTENSLERLNMVEASHEEREADIIAIAMRKGLEEKDKTTILVTPDRNLSRRVAAKLRRWNIDVDDSAGIPLGNTPCGNVLRLCARWLCDTSDATALVALMRHTMFGGSLDQNARQKSVNKLDVASRGVRAIDGEALLQKLTNASDNDEAALTIIKLFHDAHKQWQATPSSFHEKLTAHIAIAEEFCATGNQSGVEVLWRGDDGEVAATTLEQVAQACAHLGEEVSGDYAILFEQMIAGATVRVRGRGHARLAIYGPLEARLQSADTIILGGLNEGAWPQEAQVDPFLSRPMRAAIGLSSPERRIGLAAHDFAQLAAAPSVLLTRAKKAGGKPTKPSRWIVRLKNIIKGAELLTSLDVSETYNALADQMDAPANNIRLAPPSPTPPIEARPRRFFVTRIEKLLRDPYAVYARYILRLKKLDQWNEDFSNRELGNLFHALFEGAARTDFSIPKNREKLQTAFDRLSADYGLDSEKHTFIEGQVKASLDWFAAWNIERAQLGSPEVIEGDGAWAFQVGNENFELRARADRIDLLTDGRVAIIDYKTGTIPETRAERGAFSPQLPLTALIVEAGGFEELGARTVQSYSAIKTFNRKSYAPNNTADQRGAKDEEAKEEMMQTRRRLEELLGAYLEPGRPYLSQPRAKFADTYGDYDLLARRRERETQGGSE